VTDRRRRGLSDASKGNTPLYVGESLEEAGRARPAEEADKVVLVVEEKKERAAC
jgi:hypothetical protein